VLSLDADAGGRRTIDLPAQHACGAEDGVEDRRLARPVGTGQPDDLAAIDSE
jgi:hypothetical protein